MLIAGCAAIERLLRDGNYFDVNRPTTTTPTRLPMRFAIRNNRLDLVQLLIHHRADPNAHDEEGTTLQAAFDNPEPGSSEILRFLLACGAHPDGVVDDVHSMSVAKPYWLERARNRVLTVASEKLKAVRLPTVSRLELVTFFHCESAPSEGWLW